MQGPGPVHMQVSQKSILERQDIPVQLQKQEVNLSGEQSPEKQDITHLSQKLEQVSNIARTAVPWGNEESKLLVQLRENGLTWKEIATRFSNRTLNACQFRWKRISLNGGIHSDENDLEQGNNKCDSKLEVRGEESKAKQVTPDDISTNKKNDNCINAANISTTGPTKRNAEINLFDESESSLSSEKEQKKERRSLNRSKRPLQEEAIEDRPYFKRLRSATRSSRGISNLLNSNVSETRIANKAYFEPVKDKSKKEQDLFESKQRIATSKEDLEYDATEKSGVRTSNVQGESEKCTKKFSRVLKLEELVDNNVSRPLEVVKENTE